MYIYVHIERERDLAVHGTLPVAKGQMNMGLPSEGHWAGRTVEAGGGAARTVRALGRDHPHLRAWVGDRL